MSTGGAYGRFCNGTLGLHEGAEEILASSDNFSARTPWKSDRPDPGIGGCSLHLYPVLKVSSLSVAVDQWNQRQISPCGIGNTALDSSTRQAEVEVKVEQ